MFFITALCALALVNALLVVQSCLNRANKGVAHTAEFEQQLQKLAVLQKAHAAASALFDLVKNDGAGTWPPAANHDSWPLAFRPYQQIYWELLPTLSSAGPLLDDDVNLKRRNTYRSRMRVLLKERVDLSEVIPILTVNEYGQTDSVPKDVYNAFYCCVAVCRHAYRWAMIPVVKVAQRESVVDFPPELDAPWPLLQQHFGVTADSGNNTANVLLNFDRRGNRRYKINLVMPLSVRSSEEVFFKMFYDVEVLAWPVYYAMVMAIISFDNEDHAACLHHLRDLNKSLRPLLKVFFDNMVDSRIQRAVWLSYVQGFQGWGVGRYVDGEYVKYDGLSGNHVLAFHAIDAFLGLDTYLTEENMVRYIPINQRIFSSTMRAHDFRSRLKSPEHDLLIEEVSNAVNRMRLFRVSHRARVMSYLQQPAPERMVMTAGKSVLETAQTKSTTEALSSLDKMLVDRLAQTT